MANQRLAIKTNVGYLNVVGSLVACRGQRPFAFLMTSTGPIDYGATVQLRVGSKTIVVDPATSEMHAVGLMHPGQIVDFVIKPLRGSGPTFVDGSEFALLSSHGCVRCSDGNVKVGGAVDTDAPARLIALFR